MKHTGDAIVALDVGGTTIDAAVIGTQNDLITPVQRIASPKDNDVAGFVETLGTLVAGLNSTALEHGYTVRAVGIGIPGPFDYERGIALMTHKFRKLYGKNVKQPLEHHIGLPVFFLNDAHAFTIGAARQHQNEAQLLAITIGTGLGGGMAIAGNPQKIAEIEIWNTPFHGEVLEETASARGIERAWRMHGGAETQSVSEIAQRARQGDAFAQAAFNDFATALGAGLAFVARAHSVRPSKIVLGGQIGKAFDLFGEQAAQAFTEKFGERVPFQVIPESQAAALMGAAAYARQKLLEPLS